MKKILLIIVCTVTLIIGFESVSESQTKTPEQDKKQAKATAFKRGEPVELIYDAGAVAPNKVRFLTTSEETNGEWSLVELTEMPGTKTTWHRHNRTDQSYYVLEGKITFKVEENVYELDAGGYVFIPRGTPHGHGNFTKNPARVLLNNTPGGFEQYFNDRANLLKTMKPENPEFKKKMSEFRKIRDAEELGVWDIKK